MQSNKPSSSVSVIIPCYNHARYLGKAIQSVLDQQYPNIEVLVVDDGSTDDTREVAASFPSVKYIAQSNQGLSAARNTGIENSNGAYLVFLDADDWLLKNAISINAAFLEHDRSLGFVSGGFLLKREGVEQEVKRTVNSDHYIRLLQGNYISMHATVMYNRKVFKTLRFDAALKACEDYDVYLQVTRDFPVLHHTQLLAVYWHHDLNMSSDLSLMLKYATEALKKQEPMLRTAAEKEAYRAGLAYWNRYYAMNMYSRLVNVSHPASSTLRRSFLDSLWNNNRKYFFKYLLLFPLMPLRKLRTQKTTN